MQPPACHARLASRRASILVMPQTIGLSRAFFLRRHTRHGTLAGMALHRRAREMRMSMHEHAMNGRSGGAAEGQVDSADPTWARIQSPLSSKHLTPSTSCVPCNWAEEARRQRGMRKKCPGHNIPVLGLSPVGQRSSVLPHPKVSNEHSGTADKVSCSSPKRPRFPVKLNPPSTLMSLIRESAPREGSAAKSQARRPARSMAAACS